MEAPRSSFDMSKAAAYYPDFVRSSTVHPSAVQARSTESIPVASNGASVSSKSTPRSSVFYPAMAKRHRKSIYPVTPASVETASSNSSQADALPADRAWFKIIDGERFLPSSLESSVAYWAGYTHAQRDWVSTYSTIIRSMQESPFLTFSPRREALTQNATFMGSLKAFGKPKTSLPATPQTPRKFLDVGCGCGLPLILKLAEAWPECHFTGLDIAPSLLDLKWLPPSVAHRIHFVQANYLERLPFDDDSFDMVLCGDLGSSVPEHTWQPIMEEVARVCQENGIIEIAQTNFNIGGSATIGEIIQFKETKMKTGQLDLSPEALVVLGLIAACDKRLLSPFPTAHIKAALVLSAKINAETPHVPIPCTGKAAEDLKHCVDYLDPAASAVLQHTQATGIAQFACSTHPYLVEATGHSVAYRDVTSLYDAYKRQHHEEARLARLLESELGWNSTFDERSLEMMESNLRKLKKKAQEAKTLESQMEASDWSNAMAELDKKIRDIELEIKAAKKRLLPRTVPSMPLLELKVFVATPNKDSSQAGLKNGSRIGGEAF